ncbi:annexin D5 [Andrographis paniculata]|uniref:annexin D5 n=1 Tax=Andrographis paniculata TaxID=175694 RepID=UPI0021E9430A|nr:annexin D5 [Andrographis paniculata]XP_051149627.1 annexin D5 [Andrographis paniculata]
MATLTVPPVVTTPRDDAVQLHRAFKGFGCDTAAVVNILAHRDSMQRSYIEQEYRTMYSEELSKRLGSELRGDLKKAVLSWMPDPGTRDATIVKQAFSGDVIDLKAATEVICSRTPSQIQQMKQIYLGRFRTYLEHDIEHQASGDHKKLLLAYVTAMRYEGPEVDRAMAEQDAKSLYKAGEKRLGTDERTFIRIFSERSRAHLNSVASAYHNMYGNSLKKAIKKETSGTFEFALLTILQSAVNPGKYFAKLLHKAMKGLGTNDTTLIRIIVTRAEMDMHYIKVEYEKKYRKPLNDAVHSETSGHYRTFLLSLLGATHHS